ncbi:hypothetical protein ABZ470_39895 [Streptosporangium sp. NPDC020072]|uniref:hypothetical protein n=1 Tax=Streptosporangium sp. NPDC020072 TaxID=3154788 RepID=UPI0034167818
MKRLLTYGLGVDSTAILTRWLTEPASRDFPLEDLVVLTAQTGDEWAITKHLVETYMYPMLAEHQVRTVQVARKGPLQEHGVKILADTRTPTVCHTKGAYKLSDEMLAVATVPQLGGEHRCALKFKGFPLDWWTAQWAGGEPYWHAVGFETTETGRIRKDLATVKKKLPGRIPAYPLHEWGWDRETCHQYLTMHFGVTWEKSACTYCPFALSSPAGRDHTISRYLDSPEEAMLPLVMEYVSIAVNSRQSLRKQGSLHADLVKTPGSAPLLARFTKHLHDVDWAVYRMRRALLAKSGDMMARGETARSLVTHATGSREQMLAELHRLADKHQGQVQRAGDHHRLWLAERNPYFPCREDAFIAAPATAIDKTNDRFPQLWDAAVPRVTQLTI